MRWLLGTRLRPNCGTFNWRASENCPFAKADWSGSVHRANGTTDSSAATVGYEACGNAFDDGAPAFIHNLTVYDPRQNKPTTALNKYVSVSNSAELKYASGMNSRTSDDSGVRDT